MASCSVYAPILPSTPQIRDKGQLEVQGSTFLNGRWEGSATYSPLRHVLVRAAGDWKNDSQDTSFFRIRQFEVAAGSYWVPSEQWLISGLAGYGRARSARGYYEPHFFSSSGELVDLQSRYHKVFGEVAATYRPESGWIALGAAYRLSRVNFEYLTYNGAPSTLRHMLRSEPMLFVRFGGPDGPLHWLQVQTSWGITSVPGYSASSVTPEPYEYGRVKESRTFIAISLILLPHLFKPQPPIMPVP
ncbi:hypothetical protein SAMN06265337_2227 [Hymenobacter gelipurpurascens]|uniref:DUF2490 domain-containing protein n=1 Tax=Hymenobacter gelipurpurascens TaxID=89968 RepID=A0A212TQH1_9BACT|nr:hypothetical protein [Hymenobacter gelipurpurascens]SNC68245.1 hypothetical protein SAMN06265337_2227 [Hymenobacter gelipurpurascens]